MEQFILLIIAISACYLYAFVAGFTDAAQAIAEAIGARSLSPPKAVFMAGTLEVVGALTGTAVALTIGKGIIRLELVSLFIVPAAIFGALSWSLIAYYFGIPVSETHGLIGGVVGAALAMAKSLDVVYWHTLTKIVIAIFAAPILGFLSGFLLMGIINRLLYSASAKKMTNIFHNLQRLASAYLAFSHGQNDAQKPMGIMTMALALYYGWKDPTVPLWVIVTAGIVAGLGVLYGGWRIVKTLGIKLTRLRPEQGFTSNLSAGSILQLASFFGIPVSTTHTDAGAIMGVGTAYGLSRVRWMIASRMIIAWIVTLPMTIFFGFAWASLLGLFFQA